MSQGMISISKRCGAANHERGKPTGAARERREKGGKSSKIHYREILECNRAWPAVSNLLEVSVAASSATVVVNFASWWFVWKHERGAQDQSSRDLKDQLFWIGFSYLLPLLPAIIAVLGPGGGGIFSEKAVYGTFGFVTVLAILFGVLMTGLSISNYGWKSGFSKPSNSRSY